MSPRVKKNLFVLAGTPVLLLLAFVLVLVGGQVGAYLLINLLTLLGVV